MKVPTLIHQVVKWNLNEVNSKFFEKYPIQWKSCELKRLKTFWLKFNKKENFDDYIPVKLQKSKIIHKKTCRMVKNKNFIELEEDNDDLKLKVCKICYKNFLFDWDLYGKVL